MSKEKTLDKIKEIVTRNPVVIFMKGTPSFPQCGYSSRTVNVLKKQKVPFIPFDVLTDLDVFQYLPEFANWPTFPQVYVKGDLIGGCDIITEMGSNGQLEALFKEKNIL